MKAILRYLMLCFSTVVIANLLGGCDDENLPNNGNPRIRYVRVTNPASSDSLLVAAGQGQMIAIMGDNLGNARELWINDRPAVLTPTFITNTSIITRIPAQIPEEITNKMILYFADGSSLVHDFIVDISKPRIDLMRSEFVNTGDVAVIDGNYFYEPLTVTFAGGVTGELVNVDDEQIEVRVPEGAEPGPITITTNFGATNSNFWFRDNRNTFGSMDVSSFDGWWHGSTMIVASDPDIESISNKFLRVNNQLGTGQWFEFFVGSGGALAEETKKIPEEAITNPDDYSLKFEINTLSTLAGAKIHIYIGNDMGGERDSKQYIWLPNVDTAGKWETISIPFSAVLSRNPDIQADPNGYGISFWFWESEIALLANFGMDNVRVVPNTLD